MSRYCRRDFDVAVFCRPFPGPQQQRLLKKEKKGWLEAAEAYGAKNREERPLEPNAEERKRAYANNVNPWSRSSAADAAVEAVGVVDAVNSHNLHHRWRHAEFH